MPVLPTQRRPPRQHVQLEQKKRLGYAKTLNSIEAGLFNDALAATKKPPAVVAFAQVSDPLVVSQMTPKTPLRIARGFHGYIGRAESHF